MTKLFFLLLLLISGSYSSILHFKLKDENSGKIIPKTSIAVFASKEDNSKSRMVDYIEDSTIVLFRGENIISIWAIGYVKKVDTLYAEKENQDIYKDFFLERAIIKSTPEIEKYHQKLESYSIQNTLLSINVDSVKITKDKMYFSFSIFNHSDFPIYILRTIGCIKPIIIELSNDDNEIFKPSFFMIDCVGEKEYPDSSDIIEIQPKTKRNYPTYEILKAFRPRLHSGVYTVKVIYEYKKPENYFLTAPVNYREIWKDQIETMNKSLRGRYTSINKYLIKIQ